MIDLLLVLAGFVPLVAGANMLVDGASSLAKRLKVPPLVIGLTIVAFGTSAPEMVVNFFAAADRNTDIVLGNIVGSNIFNILFILGLSAAIRPLEVKKSTTWYEIPLTILAAVLVFLTANDGLLEGTPFSAISRIDGAVFLLFFAIFLGYNITLAKSGGADEELVIHDFPLWRSVVYILAGLVLLVIGGKVIVEFATRFAHALGVSDRIIALTIVSIGTSLPELATSVVAATRKQTDIAIGNVVGSNLFNVLFILGASALITPVPGSPASNIDMLTNLGASVLLFVFIFTGKGRRLDRWEGIIFLAGYLGWLIFTLLH